MVLASKDNEEVDVELCGDVIKEGAMSKVGAESHPGHKETGLVGLYCRHDATSGCIRRREELRAKSMVMGNWHIHQGLSCGNLVLNKVSNSLSDMPMLLEIVSDILFASPLMCDTSWK